MTEPTTVSRRPEFPYLDGLRGLAALLVVCYHAFLFTGKTGAAVAAMPMWGRIISLGYLGVPIFIVLSGYVLMIPVAASGSHTYRRGTWDFLKRRSRRILPPYYAALAFALLLIAAIPAMKAASDTQWDTKIPVTPWALISHLFLFQDFSAAWADKIDGPLWSVAVEFQIYLVMAFILLALWRRIGAVWTTVLAVFVSAIPGLLGVMGFAHPWFLGLFAVGMAAAQLTLNDRRIPLLRTMTVVAVGLIPVGIEATSFLHIHTQVLIEVPAGLAVAGFLIWTGRPFLAGRQLAATRPLSSKLGIWLGTISYSVYLFHSPLLGLANILIEPLGLGPVAEYALMMLVVVPIDVAICWGLFWLVERHFLNARQRHATAELREDATAEHFGVTGGVEPESAR